MNTVEFLGLSRRIGMIGWLVFAATTAGLLLLTPDAAGRWQDWFAYASIAGAAALGVSGLPGLLPASRAWIMVGLCLLASTLPLWVETEQYVSFAPWYLRAITEVAVWMALRGRPLQAWIAAALASGLAAALVGQPLALMRQLATLLAVQVLVLALGRAARAIAAWREEERSRVEQEETRRVAVATRRSELAAIASRAEPLLMRLVSGESTPAIRREAGLLEAALRDTMRARKLAVNSVASATDAARRRGIEVTLLDDLDGMWSSPDALDWAASLIATASAPVTVRLSVDGLTFVSGTVALRHAHHGGVGVLAEGPFTSTLRIG
ncbi:MAG: hypothetical protein ABI566_13270 [Pseudolysinimonas sp.]